MAASNPTKEGAMPRNPSHLPSRFPAGTKYVIERRGSVKGMMLVHRYVEFPDGRQIELSARLVPACCGEAATATAKPATARRARTGRTRVRAAALASAG
jgi:hypothetical protein